MKRSNILLLALSLVLVSGVYITDHLLAQQYLKINLNDPYKNFDSLSVQPFKALRITGGNSYAIRIAQGKNYSVRVMHSRKSFFSMKSFGDTLSIGFTVANQQYQSPEKCTVGVIITVPEIASIQLSGTNNEIGPFLQDSLLVKQDKNTVTRLKNLELHYLHLRGSGVSYFDFLLNIKARSLAIAMENNAVANLRQVSFQEFSPAIRDSAGVILYGQTINMFRMPVVASDSAR